MTEKPEGDQTAATSATPQIDPQKLERFVSDLKSKQNFALAALTGAGSAAAGAALWATVTVVTNFQIGLMAIAIGCAVGMTVRKFGQGMDKSFAVLGAVETLLGCMAGNLLTVCAVISKQQGIPFFDILSRLTPDIVISLMSKTFDGMDLLFYGIAVYEAYKFSIRHITPAELGELRKETN